MFLVHISIFLTYYINKLYKICYIESKRDRITCRQYKYNNFQILKLYLMSFPIWLIVIIWKHFFRKMLKLRILDNVLLSLIPGQLAVPKNLNTDTYSLYSKPGVMATLQYIIPNKSSSKCLKTRKML